MMKTEARLGHPAKFPRKATLSWVNMMERGRRCYSENTEVEIEARMEMSVPLTTARTVSRCLSGGYHDMVPGWDVDMHGGDGKDGICR